MDKIKIWLGLLGGITIAIFCVITFFTPTKDLIFAARNNSSVANYPKLGSLMDFSVLGLLIGAIIVVFIVAWKRRKTG